MTISLRKIGCFISRTTFVLIPKTSTKKKLSLLSYRLVKISRQIQPAIRNEDETLETMLKRVVHSLGLVDHSNENPRRKNKVKRKHHHQDKTKENIKLSTPNTVKILHPNECRINENCEAKETNWLGEEKVNAKVNMFQGGEDADDESCFSAKEFYVSKDKSARCSRRKGIVKGKKPFVAPFPMARLYRDNLGWKPSLATVDDLSP